MPLLTPVQLMNANKTVAGVHIGRLVDRMDLLSQELTEVLALWAAGIFRYNPLPPVTFRHYQDIYYHLALAYQGAGNMADAKRMLTSALALKREFAESSEATRLLSTL